MFAIVRLVAIAFGIAAFGSPAGAAVPAHRPTNPQTVLLRLGTGDAQLARLRSAANTVEGTVAYVNALIASGQRTGDERYYGYAEQALRDRASAPQLQLLQARLLQHRHEFAQSESQLGELMKRDSRDRAARLMRAQVRLQMKDAKGAMQDCVALVPLVDVLTSTTCIAQARAALGDLPRARALLEAVMQRESGDAATRSWSAGVAAEFAARMGDAQVADRRFQEAIALDPQSHYARISYADWLLWNGQAERARQVAQRGNSLADRTRVVLAEASADSSRAREMQLLWREATARGERAHLRDVARFAWFVRNDARAAHAVAIDNFRDHRDGDDALLLATTAMAVNDRAAIARVGQWQRATRYQDARLQRLLERKT